MELRHLRYFVAVAEELSFSSAAKRLHIAQPPLSQQIRDLERELELELFDRSRRKIRLTRAGVELLRDARHVLDSVDQLERRSSLRAQGTLGHLSIAIIGSAVSVEFAAMLRKFQAENPNIKFSVIDQPSLPQLDALTSGNVDVGFLRPPAEIPSELDVHLIKREPMKLGVPSHHPMAGRKRVEWEDLAKEDLILLRPEIASDFYDDFFRRCRKAGFEPRILQHANNASTQLWLTSVGLGIAPLAIVPEFIKRDGISLIDLPEDASVFETKMVWRRNDYSPSLRRFVEFVRENWKSPPTVKSSHREKAGSPLRDLPLSP